MAAVTEKIYLPEVEVQKTPPPAQEEGLASSPLRYIAVAAVIAALGIVLFPVCFPVSIALWSLAAWLLWSGVMIVANRAAQNSCLEGVTAKIHAMTMEVNSGFATVCLFPLTPFDHYHQPVGPSTGRPILMVNGYLSFGSTWHYQRKRLAEAGFGPIYTMNVGSGRSITTYAKYIEDKAKMIQKETGRNDLDVVSHSKGGLVSSYFAAHLAEGAGTQVKNVVTIGSPLAGTRVAYLGLGYDAAEMRSGAGFHKELRERWENHPHTRFLHIGSEADEIVPISSALPGIHPERELRLKDMGHLGLLFSSRVTDQIATWLKG